MPRWRNSDGTDYGSATGGVRISSEQKQRFWDLLEVSIATSEEYQEVLQRDGWGEIVRAVDYLKVTNCFDETETFVFNQFNPDVDDILYFVAANEDTYEILRSYFYNNDGFIIEHSHNSILGNKALLRFEHGEGFMLVVNGDINFTFEESRDFFPYDYDDMSVHHIQDFFANWAGEEDNLLELEES